MLNLNAVCHTFVFPGANALCQTYLVALQKALWLCQMHAAVYMQQHAGSGLNALKSARNHHQPKAAHTLRCCSCSEPHALSTWASHDQGR